MNFIRFFLQVILVLLVFSCTNPNQNIHGAVDPEDLVRLASAVVTFGPFPGHLSQTRRPPRPPAGLLPDVGMGSHRMTNWWPGVALWAGPEFTKKAGLFDGDVVEIRGDWSRNCSLWHFFGIHRSNGCLLDICWMSGCQFPACCRSALRTMSWPETWPLFALVWIPSTCLMLAGPRAWSIWNFHQQRSALSQWQIVSMAVSIPKWVSHTSPWRYVVVLSLRSALWLSCYLSEFLNFIMAVTSSKPQLSLVTHIRTTYGHTSCGPCRPFHGRSMPSRGTVPAHWRTTLKLSWPQWRNLFGFV